MTTIPQFDLYMRSYNKGESVDHNIMIGHYVNRVVKVGALCSLVTY